MITKNNKGFTLVELVVSMAITLIITVAISSVLLFSYRSFFANRDNNEIRIISNGIKNEVIERLTFAKTITITDEFSDISSSIYFKDGRLYSTGDTLIFPDAFYLECKVDGKFTKTSSSVLNIKIDIISARGYTLTQETDFKIINLPINNAQISDNTAASGSKINYTK